MNDAARQHVRAMLTTRLSEKGLDWLASREAEIAGGVDGEKLATFVLHHPDRLPDTPFTVWHELFSRRSRLHLRVGVQDSGTEPKEQMLKGF